MATLPEDINELIQAFQKWYINDPHSSKENYYGDQISKARIEGLSDSALAEFFFQFAHEGGKVQSGGHRKAPLLRKSIEQAPNAFRMHILRPFEPVFEASKWLSDTEQFKGWGKGIATIYLNRVDSMRFVIVNEKSENGYKALGYTVRSSPLVATYTDLHAAQSDLLDRYPELINFFRTDAFSHFLLGTEEGKELIGLEEEQQENNEGSDNAWLTYKWVRNVTRADWEFFMDECKKLIEELELDENDERLVLNLRNGPKRLSLAVLTRIFLSLDHEKTTTITVQLRASAEVRYPEARLTQVRSYKNDPQSKIYALSVSDYRANAVDLFAEMLSVCNELVAAKGPRSRQRTSHIQDLYPMVTDHAFRADALDHLLEGKGTWPGANANANITTTNMEYFTSNDVERLEEYSGVKRVKKNTAHEQAYRDLRITYEKVRQWATLVQRALFPDGHIHLLAKPTNQAGIFERYQWAKIYPTKEPTSFAYTVSIENGVGLVIKIDSVGLRDNDQGRKKYLMYRGEYERSHIVNIIPEQEALSLGWDELTRRSVEFIRSVESYYNELNGSLQNADELLLKELIAVIGPTDAEYFFEEVSLLLASLDVGADDQRVSFSLPNKRNAALTIGQRYCLELNADEKERFGFIVPTPSREPDVAYSNYKGAPNASVGRTARKESVTQNRDRIADSCRNELDRTSKSGFRNASNPFFEKAVFDRAYRAQILGRKIQNRQIENAMDQRRPVNTILYGPPGTGKTYKLKAHYFQRYTTRISALTREQRNAELVQGLTWWEVAALVLLDLGPSNTSAIIDHELLRIKASLSNSSNIRPILWSTMQTHTVAECESVKVLVRQQPQIFNKREGSFWEVLPNSDPDVVAELQDILKRTKRDDATNAKEVKRYEFVTFHQSFSYEDFIEGIKPTLEETGIGYEIASGIFKQLCARADKDPDNDYAIFIDEINRGNVSAIFGELISLIEPDKRTGMPNALQVVLPYSKKAFSVPQNLHIIGTMNTADRSVEALDTALRRRFSFEECPSRPAELKSRMVNGVDLTKLLTVINARIEMLLDRDHHIGHSYFMNWPAGDQELKLRSVFKNNIVPLLQDYFYGDPVKLGMVLGAAFVEEVSNGEHKVKFAGNFRAGEDIEPKPRYAFSDPLNEEHVPLQAFMDICDGK